MWLLGRIIYWCLLYQITGANYLICRHFKIRHILSVLQALLYTFWARIIYILSMWLCIQVSADSDSTGRSPVVSSARLNPGVHLSLTSRGGEPFVQGRPSGSISSWKTVHAKTLHDDWASSKGTSSPLRVQFHNPHELSPGDVVTVAK